MEFLMYYSTLLNLACATHAFHDYSNVYFDSLAHINAVSLLCAARLSPPVTPHCHYDTRPWGFPPKWGKPKRKRGGQHKIRVVTDRRPQITNSRRQVCESNLISIKTDQNERKKEHQNQINIGYINVRSVTGKENILEDLILEKNFDFLFLTETWLRPSGDEVKISNLTPANYSTVSAPRMTGPGGGIGFTFKDIFKPFVKTSVLFDFQSFECLKCNINMKSVHFTMFCIYRPPPSAKNRLTHSKFLNDFECFLTIMF